MLTSTDYSPPNYLDGNIEMGTWDIEDARSCKISPTLQFTLPKGKWLRFDFGDAHPVFFVPAFFSLHFILVVLLSIFYYFHKE